MSRSATMFAIAGLLMAGPAVAQGKKAAGTKMVMHDITVKTSEAVYTGTMEMGISDGKVTGKLHITAPGEVVGDVAGTSKAGVMSLDFPYRMTERNCDGNVKMTITLPPKPGPATGTMEAIGCGREPGQKLEGTVELKPAAPKPKK